MKNEEAVREEAQLEWALEELQATDAHTYRLMEDGSLKLMDKPAGPNQRVIVVPKFQYNNQKRKWLPTDDIIIQGKNKSYCSIQLMALPSGISDRECYFPVKAWAPMLVKDSHRFHTGMLIEGRIDTAYTLIPPNPNNLKQDKWYLNTDAQEADIACTDENGNFWYQKRYFENDLNFPVQPIPKVNSQKIFALIASAKREKGKDYRRDDDRNWREREAVRDAIRGMDEETDGFWRDL